MANITAIQTLVDGPRNVVIKLTGILDTADIANTTLIDPATLSGLDDYGTKGTRLVLDHIDFNVESALAVNLFWDATTPILIASLTNSGEELCFKKVGGLTNNAGAGINGKLLYATQGWSAAAILSFTVVLHCRKR